MQVIETKYISATSLKPSRISAVSSGNSARVVVSYDSGLSDAGAHIEALQALCAKLGWAGSEFIGGHSKDGMVWVNMGDLSPRVKVG